MTYNLVYTVRASRDLHAAADAISLEAPETAERWFNGFVAALATLSRDAEIYSLAPESNLASVDVRQFIYRTKSRKANRALYTIRGATVYILAIRRPGQDLLTATELRHAVAEVEYTHPRGLHERRQANSPRHPLSPTVAAACVLAIVRVPQARQC